MIGGILSVFNSRIPISSQGKLMNPPNAFGTGFVNRSDKN